MLPVSRLFMISMMVLFPLGVYAQTTVTTVVPTTTTTTVERGVIVSPVPKAVCKSIPAHWEGSVWQDTHNECTYTNRPEGIAWIDAYWSCTEATADGTCTTWTLVPGRWVTSVTQ